MPPVRFVQKELLQNSINAVYVGKAHITAILHAISAHNLIYAQWELWFHFQKNYLPIKATFRALIIQRLRRTSHNRVRYVLCDYYRRHI
jgi:NADH:ubiquinone oxidoreductase subunit